MISHSYTPSLSFDLSFSGVVKKKKKKKKKPSNNLEERRIFPLFFPLVVLVPCLTSFIIPVHPFSPSQRIISAPTSVSRCFLISATVISVCY